MNPSLPTSDLNHILDRTRNLWDELRGQRLFITGGTGFFGCWLLESFLWACDHLRLDAQIVVLTRNPDVFRQKAPHLANHPALTLLTGDVQTCSFPSGSFSHILHAATPSSNISRDIPLLTLWDVIVNGTRRVLDFSQRCGTNKLLFVSSGAVYGKQPSELSNVPENFPGAPDPLAPPSAYAEGKRTAELLCSLYAQSSSLQVKIARCFAFVGPHLPINAHFAIGNFIRDGLAGVPIQISGDGTPFRSYLYSADLAIWLWTLLINGQPGTAYNVGSENAITILDTAGAVARQFTPPPPIKILQPIQAGPQERYIPSTQKARQELGLLEWTPLNESIRKTIQWYRQLDE